MRLGSPVAALMNFFLTWRALASMFNVVQVDDGVPILC